MSVRPRRPKGPPLNALRAFEVAARLESFVDAADELGVTPGAVSQHIKALEAWAGVELFERGRKGVRVSPAGRLLAGRFTEAFDLLSDAAGALRNSAHNPELRIATMPSVAQLWLPARLAKIRAAQPHLTISVTALETPPRLSSEVFDMAIFFEPAQSTVDQIVLAEDRIFPVAAPSLSESDLAGARLLHDLTWDTDWAHWSARTGVPVGDPQRGPKYSLYALAVAEAKSGAGVLMAHESLVEADLASGELCKVSGKVAQTKLSLVASLPHKSRRHPATDVILEIFLGQEPSAPSA